jgi:ABC-2 type transport system ATP-binding protein
MKLEIRNVTKRYGQQLAVNGISFQVNPGEIVGFLGPNGAGKSTTMKIITGYVPVTQGVVSLGGIPIDSNPIEAKRSIGYLPEHNPLYSDLYIHEYLRFVGRLYGLSGRELNKRVEEMVEVCGLTAEQNKRIETLSKGYRQRVGLAQALLHDPPVLILDEPTTGLDPNQIVEIRALIKQAAASKTVLFSTHIMQEVQAICDRVIVINQGVIVADSPLQELLTEQADTRSVVAEFETTVDERLLLGLPGVTQVQRVDERHFRITGTKGLDLRASVFRLAAEHQLSLVGLRVEESNLEQIFKSLTTHGQA